MKYVEFVLNDGGGDPVSLLASNIVSITMDGAPFVPVQDSANLWFSNEEDAGDYVFVIETVGGAIYNATLEFVPVV